MFRALLASASLVAVFASACTAAPPKPTVAPLADSRIFDESGEMQVGLAYTPKGEAIEFVVELRGVGTREMDKVVVEVSADGFEFVGGEMQWSGFVAPHTKHKHAVSLQADAQTEFPAVTVTVSRSLDSEVLMHTEVPFRIANGQVVPYT